MLDVSIIEIESVINTRPLNYIGEGADDSFPITLNQVLNNRRPRYTRNQQFRLHKRDERRP
jgi:hypothetical protein